MPFCNMLPLLKAALVYCAKQQFQDADRPRSAVTDVFISRLDPWTSEIQVQSFVKQEAGLHVCAEKLRIKHDS